MDWIQTDLGYSPICLKKTLHGGDRLFCSIFYHLFKVCTVTVEDHCLLHFTLWVLMALHEYFLL
jgi:hypothetical protein